MIAIVCGQFGEKLIADVIREAAQRRFAGVLRLTHAESSKAIFFEDGVLVYATSNLPHEQIEQKLIRDRLLTPDLLNAALARRPDAEQLGRTLVDMNVLSEADWQRAMRELIEQIVGSLFEWTDGDYIFEETALTPHIAKIDWLAADCVLRGARHAALIKSVAGLIAPPRTVVTLADD